MARESRLWLIRHAPVDGALGVIHPSGAFADTSDVERLNRLRARLPSEALAICSPARRTRDTARALRLEPVIDPAFREQAFGDWTGHRHSDLAAQGDEAYASFWRAPATNRPPGGDSFEDQIARVRAGHRDRARPYDRNPAGEFRI